MKRRGVKGKGRREERKRRGRGGKGTGRPPLSQIPGSAPDNAVKRELSSNTESPTRTDVGAECRHKMRPSVQLPSVSGVDSKFGPTMVMPSLQSVSEPPVLDQSPVSQHVRQARYAAIS